jgi:hypothetical protein
VVDPIVVKMVSKSTLLVEKLRSPFEKSLSFLQENVHSKSGIANNEKKNLGILDFTIQKYGIKNEKTYFLL